MGERKEGGGAVLKTWTHICREEKRYGDLKTWRELKTPGSRQGTLLPPTHSHTHTL